MHAIGKSADSNRYARCIRVSKRAGFPGENEKLWNMCDIFSYRTSRIM
jgi:hypothetical protein